VRDRDRVEAAEAALAGFPRIRLGAWPTPVEPFDGLDLPAGARVFVKREDLASPLYGGNKVRKLEHLLAAGTGPVVAFGGLGSHHVLATAVHAASLGRACTGVLFDQPRTDHTNRVLALNAAVCRRVVRGSRPLDAARGAGRILAGLARGALGRGEAPTILAPGGSSPLGTLGWVGGGLELAAQIAEGACPPVDEIYVAYGSGGTAVGLALGLALARAPCAVVAVRVATRLAGNERFALLLARRTFALLSRAADIGPMPALRLTLEHRFAGSRYGAPTAEAEEAIARAAGSGVPLEPTYTGKALAALLDAVRRGPAGRARMFLDTYSPIDKLGAVRDVERA
jgi:1-aminocyclopropane-1-carboxylate deaminase/D-cysteine desulfhydrase-like pyridoxal-dependent ACC family enzyme